MSRLSGVLVGLAVVVAVAGCGGSASSSGTSATATAKVKTSTKATTSSAAGLKISSRNVAGLGPVLVNAQGRTLYIFEPDKQAKVTCVSSCAAIWPPAFVRNGKMPVAAGAVKQSLLGSDPDPAGGRVVTYDHWPLYTYVTDTAPGSATGQALNVNGGLWYVISPSGKVITKKA